MVGVYLLACLVLVLDQLSKYIAMNYFIARSAEYPVIYNLFYLTLHANPGAAFGVFAGGRWFFIAVAILVTFICLKKLHQCQKKTLVIIVTGGVLLGGIVSNLLDRLFRGAVIDFLLFKFGTYRFPVFNIADIAIFLGAALLVKLILTKPDWITNYDS
ncbi:MAG: hypothetical protein RLZ12_163 [Bacillota bacterium]|jgi:signal peptidase II